MKLTEKCGLNSAGSSPCVTPLRTPEDLKSNILKAQAEAAALKVRNRPRGENVDQEGEETEERALRCTLILFVHQNESLIS